MKSVNKKFSKSSWLQLLFVSSMACLYMGCAYATSPASGTVGAIAGNITGSFTGIGQLMIGIAYVAGFGFTVAAIFKFKQHKDNPTQIPMGTPIALLAVGIALVFTPGVIKVGGATTGLGVAGGFQGQGALSVTS